MGRFHRSALCCVLILQVVLLGCPGYIGSTQGGALVGRPAYQEFVFQDLMFGLSVNMAGGNLLLRRIDFTIDSFLGTHAFGAVYNSTGNRWRSSFGMTFVGDVFTDDTGARYNVHTLASGELIPGSGWWYVDPQTIRRHDGMRFEFEGGKLARMRRQPSEYPQLRFDAAGITECVEAGQSCNLVAAPTPMGSVDRAGRLTEVLPAGSPRPTQVRDPYDVDTGLDGWRYEYLGVGGRLSRITNSEGGSVRIVYTSTGRVQRVTKELPGQDVSLTFEFGFDVERQLWYGAMRSPRGATTTWLYSDKGRLRERIAPEGTRLLVDWDGELRPTRAEDNGVVKSWSYPSPSHVRSVTARGNVVDAYFDDSASTRDGSRPVTLVTDSLGQVERREYDPAGQLAAIYNGEDEQTLSISYGFGALAYLVSSTRSQKGNVATFDDYHVSGHPQRTTVAGGSIVDDRTYDLVGNQLTGANLNTPGTSSLTYDHDRNVRTITVVGLRQRPGDFYDTELALVYEGDLVFHHRSDHQLLSIQRPGGGDTHFEYDADGRLALRRTLVDGVWRTTTFEAAPDGSALTTTRPNGMRQDVETDEVGRVSSVAWLRDGELAKVVFYSYRNGRLDTVVDSSRAMIPERFDYDGAGAVSRILRDYEETAEERTYDQRGRPETVAYRAGGALLRTVGAAYDLANRRTALLDDGVAIRNWAFRPDGQVASEALGSSSVHYTYSTNAPFQRLETEVFNAMGATVLERSTTYPLEGCELQFQGLCMDIATTVNAGSHVPEAELAESYTSGPMFGVLPSILIGRSGARVVRDNDNVWEYDALSNATPQGVAATWNAERNRLLAFGGNTYVNDESGFVVDRNGLPITYDAQGRTTSIGSNTLEWDGQGRLASLNGSLLRFGGALTAGGDLDLGASVVNVVTGEHLHRHADYRGNVAFVTDEWGDVVQHFSYDAYGVAASVGGGQTRSFAQGTELGDEIVMLGARMLDSTTGRFLSPDPVYQLSNQFTYTLGNPLALWDPDGREAVSATDVGFAIGGIGTIFVGSGGTLVTTANLIAGYFGTLGLPGSIATTTAVVGTTGVGLIVVGVGLAVGAGIIVVYAYASQQSAEAPPDPETGGSRQLAPDARLVSDFIRRNDGDRSNDGIPVPIVPCTPVSLTALPLPGPLSVGLLGLNLLSAALYLRWRRTHDGIRGGR